MPPPYPACEWTGLAEDEEEAVLCGKAAKGYVEDASGARHYACLEHAGTVRAHHPSGRWYDTPSHLPARRFPESMT